MMTHTRGFWVWILVLSLLAYVSYLSFRAYLNPEFLIGFANFFSC